MTNGGQCLGQGATIEADGVRFRLWAPGCDRVAVLLEADGRTVPMQPQPQGFFEVFIQGASAGKLYRY
jgi:maltooligosyltrehalose trehalohydrolase